jgi:hypothetical protein
VVNAISAAAGAIYTCPMHPLIRQIGAGSVIGNALRLRIIRER